MRCTMGRLLPGAGIVGIVRVYNPNSWVTIPTTRIVGKMYNKTLRNSKKTTTGAPLWGAPVVVFFEFPCVFAYFANNPSHWDGNPGIGIVNPHNPIKNVEK